ncbi:hypothetical protein [Haloarcula montana]|uniref:hypothetical protein n=1 Tax=Haloarcula montana TaxID=3111776 RepID=UPI002D7898E4|nr:hypothetical protein [Haloarcula sp. GH36]
MTGTETDRGRFAVLVLVGVTIALLLVGTVVGAILPGAAIGAATEDNTSHADPDGVQSERDLSATERRMAEQLAERARSGSLNISREQASQARESLNGSEYEALLDRYADVAEETGQTEKAMAFRAVKSDQAALAAAIERYWTTYDWYRALADGTTTRQQRIRMVRRSDGLPMTELATARILEREWQRVDRRHEAVVDSNQQLANVTSQNATELGSINQSVREVNTTQQTVRDEQFTPTRLSVSTTDSEASFTEPLRVNGTVSLDTGEPIANQQLRFGVGNQTLNTTTDPNGRFNLTYRPTTIPANTTTVSVRYLPSNESVYLGSAVQVDVDIQPVQPLVFVDAQPQRRAYNETVNISGRVGEQAGAANVSYLVLVDGQPTVRNETDGRGRYHESITVPASVPDGERTVRVLVPFEDQALLSANGSAPLTVTETRTALSSSATHVSDRTIRVGGTLTTEDGDPVPAQQVSIRVNETTLGTASTGRNGGFEQTFTLPAEVGTGGPFESLVGLTITVEYSGTTTNLRGATTTDSVTIPTTPVGLWAAGGFGVLLLLGLGVVVGRRLLERRRSAVSDGQSGRETPSFGTEPDPTVQSTTLLETARDRLAADAPEAAAGLAYLALRRQFAQRVGHDTSATPWEFYSRCQDLAGMDETDIALLRRVTELYEQVQFASTSQREATEAVRELIESVEQAGDATGSSPAGD